MDLSQLLLLAADAAISAIASIAILASFVLWFTKVEPSVSLLGALSIRQSHGVFRATLKTL